MQSQLASAKEEVVKPFPQAAELEEKSARLAELNTMLNMDSKVSNDVIGLDEEDQSGQPEEAVADKPQVVPKFAERAKSAVSTAQVMEDRPGEKTSVLVRLHEKQTHQAKRTKPQPAQKRSHGQEI